MIFAISPIVLILKGVLLLPSPLNIAVSTGFITVSYTHLDVYKRQVSTPSFFRHSSTMFEPFI